MELEILSTDTFALDGDLSNDFHLVLLGCSHAKNNAYETSKVILHKGVVSCNSE